MHSSTLLCICFTQLLLQTQGPTQAAAPPSQDVLLLTKQPALLGFPSASGASAGCMRTPADAVQLFESQDSRALLCMMAVQAAVRLGWPGGVFRSFGGRGAQPRAAGADGRWRHGRCRVLGSPWRLWRPPWPLQTHHPALTARPGCLHAAVPFPPQPGCASLSLVSQRVPLQSLCPW